VEREAEYRAWLAEEEAGKRREEDRESARAKMREEGRKARAWLAGDLPSSRPRSRLLAGRIARGRGRG
jgi:hypothetical protein